MVLKTVATNEPHRSRRRAASLLLGIGVLGALSSRGLTRCEVEGFSMAPTLLPGDRLLLRRRRPGGQLRPGALVAFADPRPGEDRLLVKRVVAVDGEDVTVHGDNPAATTDSRQFGPIPRSSVRWVVVRRYVHPDETRARH